MSMVKENSENHNSIFNCDLISQRETRLNNTVKLPDTLLENYTFFILQ